MVVLVPAHSLFDGQQEYDWGCGFVVVLVTAHHMNVCLISNKVIYLSPFKCLVQSELSGGHTPLQFPESVCLPEQHLLTGRGKREKFLGSLLLSVSASTALHMSPSHTRLAGKEGREREGEIVRSPSWFWYGSLRGSLLLASTNRGQGL